ncbi:hypothetical protein G6011_05151 [Alternaria panax]|uniref:Uncharacterized protein n=1 Tax=Alternaria panax TaxID=48097 RepID=A0AAD4FD87_9PLEO|nr:hypothetical protein G6011_05151 [Alternaria panax]
MANTTSLSLVAATLNVANIPTLTPMTATTMATPTTLTPTPTMSSPTTSITPNISISTTPIPIQNTQGDCLPQAPGYGPTLSSPLSNSEDTIESFYTSPLLRDPALDATTPHGYSLAFRGANASYVGAEYLSFYELEAYSPTECASKCLNWAISIPQGDEPEPRPTFTFTERLGSSATTPTSTSTRRVQVCNSFNIYFERSPAINLGSECKIAESRTLIKCALWGEKDMQEEGVTNIGYQEWDFQVVIAGSNGYRYGVEEKKEDVKSDAGKTVTLGIRMEIARTLLAGVVGLLIVGCIGFLGY